ncbi:MAG: YgjV family protein [Clostridia bacterium]|nr:YgjV family protein [Clostridia bacterium]
MSNEHIGMILSIIGMVINIFCFQAKGKVLYLILQTCGSTFFLISYFFSGGGIGIIINCIYIVRNFLFMFIGHRRDRVVYISCAMLCVSYAMAFVFFAIFMSSGTADTLWSLLPIGASIFGTVALVNTRMNVVRIWKYGDSLCWLAYNAHLGLGALGGIIGEVLNEISLAIGILRFKAKKNGQPDTSASNAN